MGRPNVNWNVGIAAEKQSTYTSKALKAGIPFASQVTEPNTKYIIKYDFTLGEDITIPANCILEFDGGSISGAFTLVGANTSINAGLVKIFNTDVTLAGSWNVAEAYPEWFGAKGDGVTDDTLAIKKTMWIAFKNRVQFQAKTYIINVTAGTDNSQRLICYNCKCAEMFGDGTVIKLGNNNNGDLRIHKGFGAMFSFYSTDSLHVKGIAFDFNYENNPIHQTISKIQDIQENTQLNAFQLRFVKKVLIEHCDFIGHSGTNCIDYAITDNTDGSVHEFTVDNCNFLKCGGKSYYNGEEAYHDVSTIAAHYRGTNPDSVLISNITNCYFEGVGGNAHNAIEIDGSVINFFNNTFKGFSSGIYPCAFIYESNVTIENNQFIDVRNAICLWLYAGTNEDSNRYGYSSLVVKNNKCFINLAKWKFQVKYGNPNGNAVSRNGFIITTGALNQKSVRNALIQYNDIRYDNYTGVEASDTYNVIDFRAPSPDALMMKCDSLVISDNRIIDAPDNILFNNMFQEIGNLVFSKNTIDNPFKLATSNGGSLIYLNQSGAYIPTLPKPECKRFVAIGNSILYEGFTPVDGKAVIINSKLQGITGYADRELIVYGNYCSSVAQYGFVKFAAEAALFGKVYRNESNNPKNSEITLNAKSAGTTIFNSVPKMWNGSSWIQLMQFTDKLVVNTFNVANGDVHLLVAGRCGVAAFDSGSTNLIGTVVWSFNDVKVLTNFNNSVTNVKDTANSLNVYKEDNSIYVQNLMGVDLSISVTAIRA